jgi:hypothetical protein
MIINSHVAPWEHWTIDNVFPNELFEALKTHRVNNADYTNVNGFRDIIKGRTFLGNEYCEEHLSLKPVAEFLNDHKMFEEKFNCDLSNTYCRPELIHDRYPFFHAIHTDTPEKKLTLIVNIDKEDEKNLATDIYVDKETHFAKTEWKDNRGLLFIPSDEKWHGFAPIEYTGIRTIMIINFVDTDVWQNTSQCFI